MERANRVPKKVYSLRARVGVIVGVALLLLCALMVNTETHLYNVEREMRLPSGNSTADINNFGEALFKDLCGRAGDADVFFSPVSVAAAMSLAKMGVTTESSAEKELNRVLPDAEQLLRRVDDELVVSIDGVESKVANSIWAKDILRPEYETKAKRLSVHVAKLPDSPEPINDWIDIHTKGLIREMVDSIDEETLALLINAVYFKGAWQRQFSESETQPGTFRSIDGSTLDCNMMHLDTKMMFATGGDGSKSVKLQYGSHSPFFAVITLPPEGSDMRSNRVDSLGTFERTQVKLALPRFSVEFVASLKHSLRALGITSIFDEEGTLDGLSTTSRVKVSDVIHKAVLEVDEYGTKAAAVTVLNIAATSFMPLEPVDLVFDRPFLFRIMHRSGLVLFMGRVGKPTFE